MDRSLIEQHLHEANRHVAEGEKHVTKQRGLVAELERDGHDTTEALRLLGLFEELQEMHIADRNRIEGELGRFPEP